LNKGEDGSVAVQFGGCGGKIANCLPIVNKIRPDAAAIAWAEELIADMRKLREDSARHR